MGSPYLSSLGKEKYLYLLTFSSIHSLLSLNEVMLALVGTPSAWICEGFIIVSNDVMGKIERSHHCARKWKDLDRFNIYC